MVETGCHQHVMVTLKFFCSNDDKLRGCFGKNCGLLRSSSVKPAIFVKILFQSLRVMCKLKRSFLRLKTEEPAFINSSVCCH